MADIIPAISGAGFKATPIGLIANSGATFEKWEAMGERLRLYQGAIQWAIGDWFNIGRIHSGSCRRRRGIYGLSTATIVCASLREWRAMSHSMNGVRT